jgi:hypothetical protein
MIIMLKTCAVCFGKTCCMNVLCATSNASGSYSGSLFESAENLVFCLYWFLVLMSFLTFAFGQSVISSLMSISLIVCAR